MSRLVTVCLILVALGCATTRDDRHYAGSNIHAHPEISVKDAEMTTIVMNKPADWWASRWRTALPTGNGIVGASVYGGVYKETVLLVHGDLWWGSQTSELPDVSDRLPEVRRLLSENKAREARNIIPAALRAKGYGGSIGAPLPLGDLTVIMPARKAFKDYQRNLDMRTGEVTVEWRDGDTRFERALFVSRTDDLIVQEVRADGPDPIDARFALGLHDPEDTLAKLNRPASPLPENAQTKIEDEFYFYAATDDKGRDFGAVARIIPREGSLTAHETRRRGDGPTSKTLHATGASGVLVLVKVFIKGEREADWERLKSELAGIGKCYAELLEPHAAEHGRIFDAMSLDLRGEGRGRSNEELLREAYKGEAPTALVEKMWAFGRYLLISSSREGGQPCELLGLWCGDYRGVWAFNMVNENLQMIYWQALGGNMPDTMLPVFDYFDRMMDDFRINAKNLYGCRGIYIPAPTAPDSGLIKHLSPHIVHWTGGAGWVAQHYYDYYLYTGDKEFLRVRALPFMREAALFYQDFFTIGPDGFFISSPSNSPENTPGVEGATETTMNATMDFAIAKELIGNLIAGAEAAGVYQAEIPAWREMLKRIPPYQINEDGAVREWMHPFYPDNYHHRHESHLYPVFPGFEVTPEEQPDLFKAFGTAVEKRLVIGLKEQSGWSMAHMANVYARAGDGDQALDCLGIMSRFCLFDNLFTAHNDWRDMGIGVDMAWAPFQIDANMGWSAAVQEMLLFSKPGLIRLLPALPARWPVGGVRGMLARGGIEVSMTWDLPRRRMTATLMSKSAQSVEVKFPRIPGTVRAENGTLSESRYGRQYRILTLEAGRPVTLEIAFNDE